MVKQKIEWIDFIRGMAIIAVLLDHSMIIYQNRDVQLYSQYSVTLFVFLAGITASISIVNNENRPYYLRRKILAIIVPYLVASFIVYIFLNSYEFDLIEFKDHLLLFNASNHFYFICFFLQLVLVSVFLFNRFQKFKSVLSRCLILILIYLIGQYFLNFTYVMGLKSGSRFLFGGTYIFVFSLGIVFYFYMNLLKKWIVSFLLTLSIVLFIIYIYLKQLEMGWSNPPNDHNLIYSFLIFWIFYGFYYYCGKYIKILKIHVLGQYSLYIYLYHLLVFKFLDTISPFRVESVWINVLIYICCGLIIPILGMKLFKYFKKYI